MRTKNKKSCTKKRLLSALRTFAFLLSLSLSKRFPFFFLPSADLWGALKLLDRKVNWVGNGLDFIYQKMWKKIASKNMNKGFHLKVP